MQVYAKSLLEPERTKQMQIQSERDQAINVEKFKIEHDYKFQSRKLEGQIEVMKIAMKSNTTTNKECSYSFGGPAAYAVGLGTKKEIETVTSEYGQQTAQRMINYQ